MMLVAVAVRRRRRRQRTVNRPTDEIWYLSYMHKKSDVYLIVGPCVVYMSSDFPGESAHTLTHLKLCCSTLRLISIQ